MRRRTGAFLVLALLLAPSLTMAASPSDPTSAPDVIAHAYGDRLHVSLSSPLNASSTVDLTFTNITGVVAGAPFELRHPDNQTVLATQQAYPADGTVNVTFPSLALHHGGDHVLVSGGYVRLLPVEPANVLDVVFGTNPITFTDASIALTITTVLRTNGTPAANAVLDIAWLPSPVTTNANGVYVYSGAAPAVGEHLVRASRDVDGDGRVDERGENAFHVRAATAPVHSVGSEAFEGALMPTEWNITYPTNATPLLAGPRKYLRYELEVALPNGSRLVLDATSAGETPSADFSSSVLLVDANNTIHAADPALIWTYNTSAAHFVFRPGAAWDAGLYQFSLRVNTRVADANDSAADPTRAEYVARWSLSVASRAPVNLAVYHAGTNVTVHDLAVLAPGAGPTVGAYALDLAVSGSSDGDTPQDPDFARNVSVGGDVLPGWKVVSYDSATGRARIEGIAPTDVSAPVILSARWMNTTTSLAIPVTRGATMDATHDTISADRETLVNVTVRDLYGNPVVDARITVFALEGGAYPGVGVLTLNGTGAPGVGANGSYVLALTPTENGTLVVHAQIGAGSSINHTYLAVQVVEHQTVLTAYVSPTSVPVGEWSTLTVYVYEDGRFASNPHEVRICGGNSNCSAAHTTGPWGYVSIGYFADAAGTYQVLVDDQPLATFEAWPHLRVTTAMDGYVAGEDGRVYVRSSDGGAPVGGADVYVYRDGTFLFRVGTDSGGAAMVPALETGVYHVMAHKAEFAPHSRSFAVVPRPFFTIDNVSMSHINPQKTTLRMEDATGLRGANVSLWYDPRVATLEDIRTPLPGAIVTWNHDPELGLVHVVVGTYLFAPRDLDLVRLTFRPAVGSLPGDEATLDLVDGRAQLAVGRHLLVDGEDARLHHGLVGAPYNRQIAEALENLL